jgi:hypothetical protein
MDEQKQFADPEIIKELVAQVEWTVHSNTQEIRSALFSISRDLVFEIHALRETIASAAPVPWYIRVSRWFDFLRTSSQRCERFARFRRSKNKFDSST